MEVQSCAVVLKPIVESDLDSVTPISEESWTRKCAVDKQDNSFDTIKRGGSVGKLKVVLIYD